MSAADPVGLPPEIADLGRRVLANCEDMQAANERLLDRNHELMTHERRKPARGKTGKES